MIGRVTNATNGDPPLKWRLDRVFDDEQVNVAVARRFTVRVRAKENDFVRVIFFFEPRDNVVNDAARVRRRSHFC